MYNNIITALSTLLTGITEIKQVATVAISSFEKYPAVVITPIGHTEKYGTLRDTEREYTFMIRAYVNIQDTESDSQVVLRTIADAIIDKLGDQDNIKLGGVVEYSKLTEGTFRFDATTGKAYIYECTYKAATRFNRYA